MATAPPEAGDDTGSETATAPPSETPAPPQETVPAGTAPGQYVAALVVQTPHALPIPGSTILNQTVRSAISVTITVPGPIKPGFTLGRPSFGSHALTIPIANTGNILVKPAGTLTVTTPVGKPVIVAPIAMGSVYGGLATKIQIAVPDQVPFDTYLVSISLKDPATGASAAITGATATLAPAPQPPPAATFTVDPVTVKASGNPVQYADVAATITNNASAIPTTTVTLAVKRNGQDVESYVLAQNQALPHGKTTVSQRYIPAGGWQTGTYTFQLIVAAVSNGAATTLATVDVPDKITVR